MTTKGNYLILDWSCTGRWGGGGGGEQKQKLIWSTLLGQLTKSEYGKLKIFINVKFMEIVTIL